MSRLCRNNMIDNPREYSEEYIISASIIEKFKLTQNQQRVIASVHNSFVGHFGLERIRSKAAVQGDYECSRLKGRERRKN